ncbi:MAG: ATP-binding protein [Firmicutes bacterium]|nr:ATP-binding protein [Bacillota bacterium]
MLKSLKLKNVGPAPEMEMELGKRLNILTGDNGLGKSFLLDTMWWTLTKKWPAEVNSQINSGFMAQPTNRNMPADILFSFTSEKKQIHSYSFDMSKQNWVAKSKNEKISDSGCLVLFSQANDCFAVYDPIRNDPERSFSGNPPAYVFTQKEIWDGLNSGKGKPLCNGLISDWAGWQKENGTAFNGFLSVLSGLSPSDKEKLEPGELTRIGLDDVRDIPSIKMPYNQEIPVLHASSGIRRVLALAYLLVWSWEEHKKAAKFTGVNPVVDIVFLIDEIENHLHPRWQRVIVRSLMNVVRELTENSNIQIVLSTHSPMTMASIEPLFDNKTDVWFRLNLDFENLIPNVVLTGKEYEKKGDATGWLTSEAQRQGLL